FHPSLQARGVTLELLTEVYRQAHLAGAIADGNFRNASQMFEHFRPKICGLRSVLEAITYSSATVDGMVLRLKTLMVCLEEVNRMESLRMRLAHAREGNYSLLELEQEIRRHAGANSPDSEKAEVFAVAY